MENNVTDIKNVCFLSFNVFISDVQEQVRVPQNKSGGIAELLKVAMI